MASGDAQPQVQVRKGYRDAAGNWHVTWRLTEGSRTLSGEAVFDSTLGRTVIPGDAPPLRRESTVAVKKAVAEACSEQAQ